MISTAEIQDSVIGNEPLTTIEPAKDRLTIGPLELPVSDSVVLLSTNHARQIIELIKSSLSVFPAEDTLVQTALNRPTALARVDCTVGPEGIVPYECEERPAGLGVDHLLNQRHTGQGSIDVIQSHITANFGAELIAVHPEGTKSNDDSIVLEVRRDAKSINGQVVIVRGNPNLFVDETVYQLLASKSVSTIRTEGDKSYTLTTPGFDTKMINGPDELPGNDHNFVVKTMQGSKTEGVRVYLSPSGKKEHGDRGAITYSRMKRFASEASPLLLEQIKPPVKVEGIGNMILRVLALVGQENVRIIGGAYTIRPEMIVHGASNTTAGLIMVDKR
jgi:hypothetical protein